VIAPRETQSDHGNGYEVHADDQRVDGMKNHSE
jgi:hypothetical protein